ncbi:MAG: hypothetical protein J6T88_04475 [Bacteroidales bacterium]|nr:hypothetical protein [Bacteroidales bacterium]
MKKIWVYILGILTGVVLTFIVLFIIAKAASGANNGMTFFDKPGQVMEESSYKVFQSLGKGYALANGCSDNKYDLYLGLTVLIYNEDGKTYYDDQIITAPKGKCFRQIGIYRYPTRMDVDKTVPIVMLMDK